MYRIFIIILAIAFLGCATTSVLAQKETETLQQDPTYEGEFSPKDLIKKWKPLKIKRCPSGQPHFHAFIVNPDKGHKVKVMEMTFIPEYKNGKIYAITVLSYRYTKDGEYFLYAYDSEQHKYLRIVPGNQGKVQTLNV